MKRKHFDSFLRFSFPSLHFRCSPRRARPYRHDMIHFRFRSRHETEEGRGRVTHSPRNPKISLSSPGMNDSGVKSQSNEPSSRMSVLLGKYIRQLIFVPHVSTHASPSRMLLPFCYSSLPLGIYSFWPEIEAIHIQDPSLAHRIYILGPRTHSSRLSGPSYRCEQRSLII